MLVDTSVWIDHLRNGNDRLARQLDSGDVLTHPCVLGELACGRLTRRAEILAMFRSLPVASCATDDEVLGYLETHGLHGSGIGWIDAHLLAAASLSGTKLWTLDRSLARVAWKLGLGVTSPSSGR